MKTQCPHCYVKFNSRDEHKGKKVKCPKCNQPFVIAPLAKVTKAESCSRCGREIGEFEQAHVSDEKIVCAECSHKLRKVEDDSTIEQVPPTKDEAVQRFSNAQPVWHLVLLLICTFGFYDIYWFYKTWKKIKNFTHVPIRPGWRTFGLFVPIYGLILIDGMFRYDIESLRKQVLGEKFIKWPLLYGAGFFLPQFFWAWWMWRPPIGLFYFISVCVLASVQGYLNHYWKKAQPNLPVRTGLSIIEIIIVAIFGPLNVLAFIGTFIMPLISSS